MTTHEHVPSDDDLDAWIAAHGETTRAFVADCETEIGKLLDDGELRIVRETVPYGSTMVELPSDVQVPEQVLRSVAFTWWEDGYLSWDMTGDELVTTLPTTAANERSA